MNSSLGKDKFQSGGNKNNILMLDEIQPEIESDSDMDASQLIFELNEIECNMSDIEENEESNHNHTEPSEIQSLIRKSSQENSQG